MKLTEALAGYMIHAESVRLSDNTIRDYFNTYGKLLDFAGDVPVEEIGKDVIVRFLANFNHLSKKTLNNYHIGLSSLWTWMVNEEIVEEHIIRKVRRPRPEKRVIEPFSLRDAKILLASLERSKPYIANGGLVVTSHTLQHRLRNRMIILVLLGTGIRASEFCDIKIKDVDLENKRVRIFGKGSKERFVPITDAPTRKAIWAYLQKRTDKADNDRLIVSATGLPLTRNALHKIIARIGDRAGVPNCHPHRFRHTFAIEFLRNGGNVYTLQQILGHSDLSTCKIYLNLAARDVQRDHMMASPVANWNL